MTGIGKLMIKTNLIQQASEVEAIHTIATAKKALALHFVWRFVIFLQS